MAISEALLDYLNEYEGSSSENKQASEKTSEEINNALSAGLSKDKSLIEAAKPSTLEESKKPKASNTSNVQRQADTKSEFAAKQPVSKPKISKIKISKKQSVSCPVIAEESEQDREIEDLFKSFDKVLSSQECESEPKNEEAFTVKTVVKNDSKSDIDAFLMFAKEKAKENLKGKPSIQQNTFENKPKIEASECNDDFVDSNEENEDYKPTVTDLIKQAETCYVDEWMSVYEKGLKSKKTNETALKIKRGRFRIDDQHRIVILADKRTDGKTAEQLLNEKWI